MDKPSQALDAVIDDCFIKKDSLCDLRREDSIELDRFANKLILEMLGGD